MQVVCSAYLSRGQLHLGKVKACRKIEIECLCKAHLTVDIQGLRMIVPE